MIPSSPYGPSKCVSDGDYTADRAHSDATKRQKQERGNKTVGEKERRVSSGMCLRKRGVIPKSWYPHQSCTTDVITVGHTQAGCTTQKTLRVTAGTTGKIHKHTHTKSTEQPQSVTIFPGMWECALSRTLCSFVLTVLAINNDLLTKCRIFFNFSECF